MPNGLIFATALLPTKGHQYLIDFAFNYMKKIKGNLHVIISSRTKEPIPGWQRIDAFQFHYCCEYGIYFHEHQDDNAPQNPEDADDFWDYWKNVANSFVNDKITHVFASEKYGIDVANSLNVKFVPCDIARQIFNIKSSETRSEIYGLFDEIIEEMQHRFKQTITFFGAESCGKSTMTNNFHNRHLSYMIPEWAREYLETVGSELTEEKMLTIVYGQYATQNAIGNLRNRPYVFQDTDLLSTIGYYRILGWEVPTILIKCFKETKSDLYIVMNSKIPFEEDPLRYGGNVRQSTDQFWIDLLNEYECNYYVVESVDPGAQRYEIDEQLALLWKKFDPIKDFIRE